MKIRRRIPAWQFIGIYLVYYVCMLIALAVASDIAYPGRYELVSKFERYVLMPFQIASGVLVLQLIYGFYRLRKFSKNPFIFSAYRYGVWSCNEVNESIISKWMHVDASRVKFVRQDSNRLIYEVALAENGSKCLVYFYKRNAFVVIGVESWVNENRRFRFSMNPKIHDIFESITENINLIPISYDQWPSEIFEERAFSTGFKTSTKP